MTRSDVTVARDGPVHAGGIRRERPGDRVALTVGFAGRLALPAAKLWTSPMPRASTPTIIRITPTTWLLMPARCALTAEPEDRPDGDPVGVLAVVHGRGAPSRARLDGLRLHRVEQAPAERGRAVRRPEAPPVQRGREGRARPLLLGAVADSPKMRRPTDRSLGSRVLEPRGRPRRTPGISSKSVCGPRIKRFWTVRADSCSG
jgi:hypothetical protein